MKERVLWVIRNRDTDYIFPTLKQARASRVGFEGHSIRIISRIVVYKFKKGTHA